MSGYDKTVDLYGDGVGSVSYISHMGDDLTVVNSARVSFGVSKDTLDDRDRKLIKYLIANRHTSTLEHNVVTFKFVVPLFVRSQHHRHRTWSYNEISRRYTSMDLNFYEPQEFRTQHKSNRQASSGKLINPSMGRGSTGLVPMATYTAKDAVRDHHARSLDLYEQLLEKGVCREQARGVLPQNLYTEYYGTTNLSNLLKFIDLRTHSGAQWEIQKVAEACLDIAHDLFPFTVDSFHDLQENASH